MPKSNKKWKKERMYALVHKWPGSNGSNVSCLTYTAEEKKKHGELMPGQCWRSYSITYPVK